MDRRNNLFENNRENLFAIRNNEEKRFGLFEKPSRDLFHSRINEEKSHEPYNFYKDDAHRVMETSMNLGNNDANKIKIVAILLALVLILSLSVCGCSLPDDAENKIEKECHDQYEK